MQKLFQAWRSQDAYMNSEGAVSSVTNSYNIDILQIQCGVLNPSYADLPTNVAVCLVHLSLLNRSFTMLSSGPHPQNSYFCGYFEWQYLSWCWIAVTTWLSLCILNYIEFHSTLPMFLISLLTLFITSVHFLLYCWTTFDIAHYFSFFIWFNL